MEPIELARRLAGLGQTEDAVRAYTLALDGPLSPEEKMEAAIYILQSGGDYRISYTCFRNLYNQGNFQEDCLSIMTQAFYEPNVKALKKRYEKNCKLLAKYPYLFRRDFPSFEELPICFYPYDDNGYVPFSVEEGRFGDYIDFKNPVVSRNFFRNLDKPILADDVFSQYELEYLHDNVRDSERIGRENHIYLHYTSWSVFCAHLQCWNLRPLLEGKKLVFMMEEERELYPIDFKERFGIDYSQFIPQPVGIREVNRLIWHSQLSFHNGGDFFNEVFDGHPNLLALPSIFLSTVEEKTKALRQALERSGSLEEFLSFCEGDVSLLTELYRIKNPTAKDLMALVFLTSTVAAYNLDQNARIAPAIFFQPHFEDNKCAMTVDAAGRTVLASKNLEELHSSPFLNGFKYIKTFAPMRRITNSYAASVRFQYVMITSGAAKERPDGTKPVVSDAISEWLLNRSYLIDPQDRLHRDSVLVRFEDGKLNPRATFTALAVFLDLPYTESMTYCSEQGRRDPHPETKGFDPVSVYRTHDGFANPNERYFLEYFMRDAYQAYGYDFNFYDGAPVDEEKVQELISGFTTLNRYIRETWQKNGEREKVDQLLQSFGERRLKIAGALSKGLRFVNENGQPLRMMPLLELDPALLEQPLYH